MIRRKSREEIAIMREAGRLAAEAHQLVSDLIEPGIETAVLDREVTRFVKSRNGSMVFKNYHGFPANICVSVNEEIVHGIPNGRRLEEGDIVSVDIGVRYKEYIGDAASTYPVGSVSPEAQRLLEAGRRVLDKAIDACKPYTKLSVVSSTIQKLAEGMGYSVVREYTGHGVGREMHEDPQVPNYIDPSWFSFDVWLKPGMVLAIEPMLNCGTHEVKKVERMGWEVVVTSDNRLSAHFEHTVAITEDGNMILTLP